MCIRDSDGTILLVSHDRALLEAVTTQVWRIEGGRTLACSYGYAEHRRRLDDVRREAVASPGKVTRPEEATRRVGSLGAQPRPTETRSRKRDKYEQKKLDDARAALERTIEELEGRLGRLERDLVAESEARNGQRIASLGVEHRAVTTDLDAKYREWAILAAQAEERTAEGG